MNEILNLLYSGNVRFFENNLSSFEIASAIAYRDDSDYSRKAKAILARAKRKEPMNFSLEVDRLCLEIFMEGLNATFN